MINVHSEIGKLNTVLVHRPGDEFKFIHPSMLAEQLFEDTPYLPSAQREHDSFTGILRNAGVEVLEQSELFTNVMRDDYLRSHFTDEYIAASRIPSAGLAASLREYYDSLSVEEFVQAIYCGVRADNDAVRDTTTLAGLVSKQGLFLVRPLTNTYFTRDSAIMLGDTYALACMAKEERRREPIMMKYIIENSAAFKGKPSKNLYNPRLRYAFEGGNVMVLSNKSVFIAVSQRTEPQAVEAIADPLFEHGFENIYVVDLGQSREYMCLDDVLTQVDEATFIYNPLLSGTTPVYRVRPVYDDYPVAEFVSNDWRQALCQALDVDHVNLISAGGDDPFSSAWETWNMGSNVLAVAPGEVVGLARAEVTMDLLDKAGITVHTINAPELTRGRAGCRCMALPINREEL